MPNHFEFYSIPISFHPDLKLIKSKYYELSKKYHPDFFINTPDKLPEALDKTAANNKAYKVLNNWDLRVKHILEINELLAEKGNKIPNSFLMEMMDVNEKVMELQMDFDVKAYESILQEVNDLDQELNQKMADISKKYDQNSQVELLEEIKEFYLKRKYVLRLKETLGKFANS